MGIKKEKESLAAAIRERAAACGLAVTDHRTASALTFFVDGIEVHVEESRLGFGWNARATGLPAVRLGRVTHSRQHNIVIPEKTYAATAKRGVDVEKVLADIRLRAIEERAQAAALQKSHDAREAYVEALKVASPGPLPDGMEIAVTEHGYAISLRTEDAALVARIFRDVRR